MVFHLSSGKGGRDGEFAEYFRRNACIQQVLGNICQFTCVFHKRNCHKKIEAQAIKLFSY